MLAAPAIHQIDGKYRVLAQLGQGGTANVSLAALRGPSGFNKLVVLKSMKHSLKSEPEFARMFMTEARLAARLSHPNIVQTNEVFEFHGLPVIVMEYLEGQPLSNVIARAAGGTGFPLGMQLRVLSDVLGGLHYSHELKDYDGTPLGVVHRDVSPHNVFVTFEGQVKLLDFGIAKLAGSQSETATGVIKGKLRYMPPEQVAAEGVDRRADIYSVGVMLWEAATGRKMWQGMSDATVMNRILSGDWERAQQLDPSIAPELERIIEKAMAPEPGQRFETAAEMQLALDDFAATLGKPPHQREIGNTMSELFAKEREQTRELIEAQLSKVASLTDAEYEQVQPIELTTFATVSGASAARAQNQRSAPARPSGVGVAALFLGVLALTALAVWRWFAPAEPTAAPAPAGSTPRLAAPASTETERVALRVTAFPASARLILAGELLPSNPASRSLPKEPARSVELVAAADGYESETRVVQLDQDWDIVLTLTPLKSEQLPQPSVAPPRTKAPRVIQKAVDVQPAMPTSAELQDCNPPYFFDERGVKKYKSRCL